MNRARLDQLARRWRRQMILRDFLFALAVGCVAHALSRFVWPATLISFVGVLSVLLVRSRFWKADAAQVGRHLDRTYPELEESAALFLRRTGQLKTLEKLQLGRVSRRLAERSPDAPELGGPPRDYLRSAWWMLAAGAGLAAVMALFFSHPVPPPRSEVAATQHTPDATPRAVPKVVGNSFKIIPPAYTARPARQAAGFTAEAEEGAAVTWQIDVDAPPREVRLISGSTSFPLTMAGHFFEGTLTLRDSTLFAMAGTLADGAPWNPPDLFSVKVIKDQPPVVRIVKPARTRTEIAPGDAPQLPVEASVTDDYGVTDAHLVATVAKGSGEAVKFREQTIPFDAGGFSKTLDLAALGMEPGDELYFYVEARDNRPPTPNRARSETRFVRLRGPEERPTTTGRGIAGIDLLPQYFRSERQLIIDTEKLIADRPNLPDAEFRARANELGADQGSLRLRYGRFLGEDQENSPLDDHLEPASTATATDVTERFRQEHAEQDRGGGGEDGPPRPPADGSALPAEQVRQPFVDSHDQRDKNTFFDTDTKGTMRDALAAMWQAEGFLRTARPEDALEPENRALAILKDLQQSARAYVQHVGFEPPPLKVAERRLKGDAEGAPTRLVAQGPSAPTDPALANIRAALATLSRTGTPPADTLEAVQAPLAAAASQEPERFLPGLQALRRLRAGAVNAPEDVSALQLALLQILPSSGSLPARTVDPAPSLGARYFGNLQTGEARP